MRAEICVPEPLNIPALKLPSYGLVFFIDLNAYILREVRKLKTFLKESYNCIGQLLLIC